MDKRPNAALTRALVIGFLKAIGIGAGLGYITPDGVMTGVLGGIIGGIIGSITGLWLGSITEPWPGRNLCMLLVINTGVGVICIELGGLSLAFVTVPVLFLSALMSARARNRLT